MPIIEPDLSQVQSLGPIAEGTYNAKIEAVEAKTSKNGNPMLVVSLTVTVDDSERKRTAFVMTSGAAAFQFESLLRATGFAEYADAIKAGERKPFDTDWLIGQELMAQIVPDTYNNELRDKIQGFMKK